MLVKFRFVSGELNIQDSISLQLKKIVLWSRDKQMSVFKGATRHIWVKMSYFFPGEKLSFGSG